MRLVNRITGIDGMVQGGTAQCALDTGPRYFGLKFFVRVNGVLTLASDVIDTVRIKVNEKAVWEISAARILALNAFNGLTDAAGTLSFHFADPGRADKTDETFTAWDTYGERSMTVELVLKTLASNTDVIRINGLKIFDFGYWADPATGKPMLKADGSRVKNIINRQVLADQIPAGQYDITKLPIANPILRIHLAAGAAISNLEVDRDGQRVFEASDAENRALLGDYGLAGNTFAYSYCPDYTEQISDYLSVRQTLNLRTTSATAQAVGCIIETLAPGFIS